MHIQTIMMYGTMLALIMLLLLTQDAQCSAKEGYNYEDCFTFICHHPNKNGGYVQLPGDEIEEW